MFESPDAGWRTRDEVVAGGGGVEGAGVGDVGPHVPAAEDPVAVHVHVVVRGVVRARAGCAKKECEFSSTTRKGVFLTGAFGDGLVGPDPGGSARDLEDVAAALVPVEDVAPAAGVLGQVEPVRAEAALRRRGGLVRARQA